MGKKVKSKHKQIAAGVVRRVKAEGRDEDGGGGEKYRGPVGTVGVFARVSVDAYDMLMEATRGANAGRGLGNGNRVTMGTVLERCIVQTLAGEGLARHDALAEDFTERSEEVHDG